MRNDTLAVVAPARRGLPCPGSRRLRRFFRHQQLEATLHTVTRFPRTVRHVEHFWITLADGCRLAARMWRPEDAQTDPVPALLEYIPYRKRDGTRERDEPMHRYFAGHGYAAVRVDIRGTGDSDGLLEDEYSEQELSDGEAVVAWLADQPWCTGRVGIIGKSWGGFNALQIAARRPPALAAVITVCSADDRYADDAHYMGGCLLNENLIWGSTLFTLGALPPDPMIVGDAWRETWRDRLEHTSLHVERWMRHPVRDEYWMRGSVCEEFDAINCPVYAVGGWADGYSNAVPRLLEGLSCPRKGLVGPWAHVYPHVGVPGPAIGFLQEALRWWDHWLKGQETGVMEGPMYRVWMQDAVAPQSFYDQRPGWWVAEETWPSSRIESQTLRLNYRQLGREPGTLEGISHRSPQTAGLAAGSWCGFGVEGEMPTDQREDDGRSLTFDSTPLDEPLEILGAPVVRLVLSADTAQAIVAVRLNDLSPDGSSTRVTYGLLNLSHRNGHANPEALTPGQKYDITVPLNHAAHAFRVGHRIRVAISTAYWPVAWPAPEPVTLQITTGTSTLVLPVRPAQDGDATLPPFPPAEAAVGTHAEDLGEYGTDRTVSRDLTTGETVYRTTADFDAGGDPVLTRFPDIDLEMGHAIRETLRIGETDPDTARAEVIHKRVVRREGWEVQVETRTSLAASVDCWYLEAELDAYEGGERVFARTWRRELPR